MGDPEPNGMQPSFPLIAQPIEEVGGGLSDLSALFSRTATATALATSLGLRRSRTTSQTRGRRGLAVTGLCIADGRQHGYDISDYQDVDPMFGYLEDLDRLDRGIAMRARHQDRYLVVNHTSDEHAWFIESRDPASPNEIGTGGAAPTGL